MALVYDPRTGQLVNVPANSPAALMQAQSQVPVIGPNGALPVTPTPAPTVDLTNLPAGSRAARMQAQMNQPVTAVQPESQSDVLGDLVSGVNKASLGAVGSLVAGPLGSARRGLTAAIGGDVNSLGAPLSDQTYGLMNEGLDQAGGALGALGSGLQSGLLNLLGAQPAPVAAPAAAEPAPVLASTAPSVPAVAPAAAQVPVAAPVRAPLTEADLAPTNATVAGLIGQSRGAGGAAAVTGNSFDATNTPRGTGAPVRNGINFGFSGGETASGYLQRMAAQDAQRALQTRVNQRVAAAELNQQSIVAHLNDPFTDAIERRQLTGQLQAGNRAQAEAYQAQDAVASGGIANIQRNQQLAAAQQAALQKAQYDLQGQLGAAGIRGQYQVQAAQTAGQATLGAAALRANGAAGAAAGTQRLANVQADSIQSRQLLIQSMLARNEITPVQAQAMLLQSQMPNPQRSINPITGAPLSDEEIRNLQIAGAVQAQQQAQKAVQR